MNVLSRGFVRSLGLVLLAASVVAVEDGGTLSAAVISWDAPQTISGDADVNTTGSLFCAYNFGPAGVGASTVNGVTFSAYEFPVWSSSQQTVAREHLSFAETPGYLTSYNTLGSASAPYSNLSSAYQGLLGNAGSASPDQTITATLSDLTNGQQYLVQWWVSNAANTISEFGLGLTTTTASAGNSVTLDSNVGNTAGGLGQYGIGTFTADGTSQDFTLDGPDVANLPMINALQVRVVPEPTLGVAAALISVGLAGVAVRRRPSAT